MIARLTAEGALQERWEGGPVRWPWVGWKVQMHRKHRRWLITILSSLHPLIILSIIF